MVCSKVVFDSGSLPCQPTTLHTMYKTCPNLPPSPPPPKQHPRGWPPSQPSRDFRLFCSLLYSSSLCYLLLSLWLAGLAFPSFGLAGAVGIIRLQDRHIVKLQRRNGLASRPGQLLVQTAWGRFCSTVS